MGGRVEELDRETQELITASVSVPSLAILVQELVYNSIDGEATCIAVRINIDRISRVQVVDNGCGIQNLVDLCEHAPTNKRKISRQLYGTRRGSLYSIVKLCERVCVTTRRHNTTTTKIFSSYQGRELISEKRNRHSKGTTITIDNVFSNMPVRSASVSYMDLEQTKDTLLKIAVANPKVAITLKDIKSGTKLFQTQTSPSFTDNFLLYCHNAIDWQRLSQVKFDVNGYKLQALLSYELHHKPRQLVYVNRRHIDDERIKRFANDILTSALGSLDRRNQENRFPVFLIFVTCKPVNVDMCFESNTFLEFNDWDSVFTLVYRCISSFLEAEQIPLNVTEDDLSRLTSPCPSLRSLLREASPNVNVKSDKVSRPQRSNSVAPPNAVLSKEFFCDDTEAPEESLPRNVVKESIVETPKKTNYSKFVPRKRVLNDANFSPHHDKKLLSCTAKPKTWALKTPEKESDGVCNKLFETPPFKLNESRLSKLQKAPVLNHLYDANEKLKNDSNFRSPKEVEKSYSYYQHPSSSQSSQNPLYHNKRRSSTPLCPSKSAALKLDISPIQISKKQFLTPSVQTKRKRKHRTSSASISKKKAAKPDPPFEDLMITSEKKFHMQTPHFILERSNCVSSRTQTKGFDFLGPNRDSGYLTISRKSSAESSESYMYNAFPASPLFGTVSKSGEFSSSELKSGNEIHDSMEDGKLPSQVFEGSYVDDIIDQEVANSFDSSPHRFKIYWDEPNTLDKEVEKKSNSVTKTRNAVFQNKKSVENDLRFQKPVDLNDDKQPVPVIIVGHSTRHHVEMLDTACSPLKIPIDRGCSPVNFTQLNIGTGSDEDSSNHVDHDEKVTEKAENPLQEVPSQQNFSFDSFSEINESILDCVDKKIDELVDKSDKMKEDSSSPSQDFTSNGSLSSLIKSPCFECHTQSVTKRLDFTSQASAKPRFPADVMDKENIRPDYKVSVPVPGATHLVANCAPWNKTGAKITIVKKSAFLDVRKWKSDVFKTHGEGSWDIQKPSLHIKFLLDATKFDKQVFDGLKVIGQIDEKFIGCVTSEDLLVLIDQHAAHERVRLECMLDTVHMLGDKTKEVEKKELSTPIPVKITKSDAEFVNHIHSKLKHIGFEIDCSKYHVNLTAIPAFCFTESGILNISVEHLVTAFHQAVQQIRESEGSNLTLPVKLVDYLHSKSCHGAIRFGDELTLEQCQVLIKQLAVCDMPFQCAHGRPSFAPIVKLKEKQTGQKKELDLHSVRQELSFLKLRSRFRPS